MKFSVSQPVYAYFYNPEYIAKATLPTFAVVPLHGFDKNKEVLPLPKLAIMTIKAITFA